MLELNISFIFHLFFIIIGCQVLTFFLNKLYESVIEYKKKETEIFNTFNNENNLLKEKTVYLEKKFKNNIQEIQVIINNLILKNSNISKKTNNNSIKNIIFNNQEISEAKKLLIHNYFISILKTIN